MNSFLRNTSRAFIGEVVTFIASMIFGIVTARSLGTYGKGELAIITGITGLLSIVLSIRFPRAVTYFVSTNSRNIKTTVFTGLCVGITPLAVYSSVSWTFPNIIINYLFKGISHLPLIVILISIASAYLWSLVAALLAGLQDFQKRTVFISMGYAIRIVNAFTLLVILNVDVVLFVTVMGVVELIFFLLWIINIWKSKKHTFILNTDIVLPMLRYAGAGYLGLLSDMVIIRIDIFFVNYFFSPSEVGIYTVAISLANTLLYIPTAIKTVLMPYVAAQNQDIGLKTAALIRILFVTLCIAGAFMIVPVLFLLEPIYGNGFAIAIFPFLTLIPGTIFLGCYSVLAADLDGRGRPGLVSKIAVFVAACTVGLDLIFVPLWGAEGAAFASTVTYGLAMLLTGIAFSTITKISMKNIFIPSKNDFVGIFRYAQQLYVTVCL